MSHVPETLKYVDSHEWIRQEDDGLLTVGITDHAQALLGDVVFIELPEVGSHLNQGDEAGVVESVKAASDVYMPISGEIVRVNEDLIETPELVNTDPYEDAWFFVVKPDQADDYDKLLDAEAYRSATE